jgi:cytochrome c-type biogenesis protein CcmH
VTLFIFACAFMVLLAVAFIAWPLIRSRSEQTPPRSRYLALVVVAILIPATAATFYVQLGRWNWQQELATARGTNQLQNPNTAEIEAMVAKLEQRLRDSPTDVDGWLMLGRSYMELNKTSLALNAYQKAYDLDQNNVDAAMGLGEAMIVADERAIAGTAGQLFEAVLARQPDNPKALWYGAVGALASGNLPRAHERLQHMLALGPPENIRVIIERQLQDIQQQMSAAGQAAGQPKPNAAPAVAPNTAPQPQRALAVQVSIAPALNKNLDKKTPLFVLVRDPAAPGPPLAAVRRAVGDLPLAVNITDNDAMLQGRGIGSVARVQVVARISKSGTPQAQPGDLYGEALVELASNNPVNVKIVIDRVVENAGGK